MIIIKRENEKKLKDYGFHLVHENYKRRYWLREMDDELCIKIVPFSIRGSLNDVSTILFIPKFNVDVEAEDVYEQIEQMQQDYELYYSDWFVEIVDKLLTDGVAEHVDAITDCVKKVSA